MHEPLAGVVIENLDWRIFVERYDRPETLFYLYPPYFGNETDYGAGMFEQSEFVSMAGALRSLKGRLVLSLNDRPEVRCVFDGFRLVEVGLTYQVGGGAGKPARQLIITDNR